jgi:(p)ppGpp synthase/HD superfamily hydrolase
MSVLTKRFTDAVDYARVAHAAQFRKGSNIPYIYHLLGVASLVIEHGGNEDQAIAGLLHDVIEDCGEPHREIVRAQFGDAVADIVEACTDGTAESKAMHADQDAKRRDWLQRKLTYIAHLNKATDAALLVSTCDKLHNARAIVADLENLDVGINVFSRFTAGREGTLRYYQTLATIAAGRGSPVASQLESVVKRMHELVGETTRELLVST